MKDILDEMSKAEIISWLRGQFHFTLHPPRKSDLLWSRWEIQTKKISDRRKAHIADGESLNMSKRDEYARQFNTSKDPKERMALIEKMAPYEKKWTAHLSESMAIMEADKKVDKLYAQIDIEREKEFKARRAGR